MSLNTHFIGRQFSFCPFEGHLLDRPAAGCSVQCLSQDHCIGNNLGINTLFSKKLIKENNY